MKNRINLVILPTILFIWSVGLDAALTPNNRLQAQGLADLPFLVLTVGSFIAMTLGILGLWVRKKTSTPLLILNQILCWVFAVIPLLVLFRAVAAVRAGL